jgi:hypothetical protein
LPESLRGRIFLSRSYNPPRIALNSFCTPRDFPLLDKIIGRA